MYDEAADAIRREIGMHQAIEHAPSVGRLAVVLVLIQLARGDQVAAEKAFKEWGNYCEVAEVQTLEMLLQAYDNEDANMARAALNSPFIKHMDVEYAKLARGLPLPATQEYAVPPVGVKANAAPSYISPNTNNLSGQATIEAEVNHVIILILVLYMQPMKRYYLFDSFFIRQSRLAPDPRLLYMLYQTDPEKKEESRLVRGRVNREKKKKRKKTKACVDPLRVQLIFQFILISCTIRCP